MRNLALLEEIGRELRSDPVLIVKRDLALLIGLHEAIILDRLAWISRNRRETANAGEPPWDGWIRGGLGFLRKQFPFISREKIEQTLRWLCELGALQRQQAKPGCPYWYRVDELALRLLEAQAVEGDGNQSEFQQVPVGIPAATSRNSSRSQTKGNELFRPSSTTAEPAATAEQAARKAGSARTISSGEWV